MSDDEPDEDRPLKIHGDWKEALRKGLKTPPPPTDDDEPETEGSEGASRKPKEPPA